MERKGKQSLSDLIIVFVGISILLTTVFAGIAMFYVPNQIYVYAGMAVGLTATLTGISIKLGWLSD